MKPLAARPLVAIGCFAVVLVIVVFVGNRYKKPRPPELPPNSASSGASVPAVPPIPPRPSVQSQYTVLLDVSASRPPAMIAEGERFMDTVINRMNYGDHLLILQMYEDGVNEAKGKLDLPLIKPAESPALDAQEELNTARDALKEPVHLFFRRAQSRPAMHTDILTTLSVASEKMPDGKRNELVLLSDMLQSSKAFEFEHLRRMPPPNWITKHQHEGLVRSLYGACVIAVGADSSTREGVIIRGFWQKYFEASNANLNAKNYRITPPSDDSSWCD